MFKHLFIHQSFYHFLRYRPILLTLLFLLTLVQGITQGVTLVMLVPLLSLLLTDSTSHGLSEWTEILLDFFAWIGVEPGLISILALYLASNLFVSALNYIQRIGQASYIQGYTLKLRRRLFRKLVNSDWEILHDRSKHNHIQILNNEIPKVTAYFQRIISLASTFIFIFSYLFLAFSISIPFSLLSLTAGLILFLLLRNFLDQSKKLGQVDIGASREMLKHIDEFQLTIKIAKVHNTEEFYYNKYNKICSQMYRIRMKQVQIMGLPNLIFKSSGAVTLVLLIVVSVKLLHIQLVALLGLILLFARTFPRVSNVHNSLNSLMSLVASVQLVMNTDQDLEDRDFIHINQSAFLTLKDRLEIQGLTFGYEADRPLYTNLDITIPAKTLTGIMGPSGCGKTTLIDMMTGLLKPDHGTLSVDGELLTPERIPAWQKHLGYLSQDPPFIDGSIRENLIWDTEHTLNDEQIMSVLREVNAEDLVTRQAEGLDTSLINYAFHFSGGERQRLALARVILRQPTLLLLDEATASLDSFNERIIMDCLARLKNKITIVFVTHNQGIEPYFDQIIHLQSEPPLYHSTSGTTED